MELEGGRPGTAAAYGVASLALGLVAARAGDRLARRGPPALTCLAIATPALNRSSPACYSLAR